MVLSAEEIEGLIGKLMATKNIDCKQELTGYNLQRDSYQAMMDVVWGVRRFHQPFR